MNAREQALKNVVGEARTKQGRRSSASFLIVNTQIVKNTASAREKNHDAGKEASGIKRYIAVDTQGFPHTIAGMTADVTERKEALLALGRWMANLQTIQSILVDGGYIGHHLSGPLKNCLGPRFKLPSAVNCTLLRYCLSAGSWNNHSHRLRNATDSGKTASVSSTPVCSSFIWLSWHYYSKDRKQVLSV